MNVWVALAHEIHPHHKAAIRWSIRLGTSSPIYFCRVTQLGLLRILTNRSAMGPDVLTQSEGWRAYDRFLQNPTIDMLEEPPNLNVLFRRYTTRDEVSTQQWADGYLAAFAEGYGLRLVTFDKALAKLGRSVLLLEA